MLSSGPVLLCWRFARFLIVCVFWLQTAAFGAMLQQFANGQQDSAQPGVPPTNKLQMSEDNLSNQETEEVRFHYLLSIPHLLVIFTFSSLNLTMYKDKRRIP